jgi:3-phosphoshikimate 1-carboxyvinyltransferase
VGGGRIIPSTETESTAYIDMTLDAMRVFGVEIETGIVDGEYVYRYVSGSYVSPGEVTVESDYSSAAFLLAGGAIGGEVTCDNLSRYSLQGDREILALLKRFGAKVERNTVIADELHGIEICAEEFPDLVPILAVVGAFCDGVTRITGAGRLRIKESDRLLAVTKCLRAMGADIKQTKDGLVIKGKEYLKGGKVSGFNDHRIVMSMAIAATYSGNPTVIMGAEAITKSYPGFFEDYKALGGRVDVINNG